MPPLWLAYGWAIRRIVRAVLVATTFGFVLDTRYSRMTVLPFRSVKSTYSLWFVLNFGWKARPRRPCSPPLLTWLPIDRNGVARIAPLL
jgi:hypothetical protein